MSNNDTKYYKGVIYGTKAAFTEEKLRVRILKTHTGFSYFGKANEGKYIKAQDKNLIDLYERLADGTATKQEQEQNRISNGIVYCESLHKRDLSSIDGIEIIYQKCFDKDGNAYAKEVITGNFFPLESDDLIEYNVSYQKTVPFDVYFDEITCRPYFHDWKDNERYIDVLTGKKCKVHSLDFDKKTNKGTLGIWPVDANEYVFLNVTKESHHTFNFKVIPKIKDSSKRIEYLAFEQQVANKEEVDSYFDKYKKTIFNKNRKKFVSELERRKNQNYLGNVDFNETVQEIKPRAHLSETGVTKEMAELESMLLKLKKISLNDYKRINEEYQNFQNQSGLDVMSLPIQKIINLENQIIEIFLRDGSDCKLILNYLEGQVKRYLNKYKNDIDEEIDLTITNLDDLEERILKDKNKYNFKEQNDMLRYIALLYFFVLYENIDDIDMDLLENSYVASNIKRISTAISALEDEKVIKINQGLLDDIDSLDDLIKLIENIEMLSNEEKGNKKS